MYEIDLLRGIVYKGTRGFAIKYDNNKMYVIEQGEKVYLTEDNSIILELESLVVC